MTVGLLLVIYGLAWTAQRAQTRVAARDTESPGWSQTPMGSCNCEDLAFLTAQMRHHRMSVIHENSWGLTAVTRGLQRPTPRTANPLALRNMSAYPGFENLNTVTPGSLLLSILTPGAASLECRISRRGRSRSHISA